MHDSDGTPVVRNLPLGGPPTRSDRGAGEEVGRAAPRSLRSLAVAASDSSLDANAAAHRADRPTAAARAHPDTPRRRRRGPEPAAEEWLTTFHLAGGPRPVHQREHLDPARPPRAPRGLPWFRRPGQLHAHRREGRRAFLGPLADEFLVFCDPDRAPSRASASAQLPAFLFIRVDGCTVAAAAEGWNRTEWRRRRRRHRHGHGLVAPDTCPVRATLARSTAPRPSAS